jgi:hypothetical protein
MRTETDSVPKILCLKYYFNPLKMKSVSCIRTFCVLYSKHSPPWLYKTNLLMLFKPKVTVCSEIHTEHINAM